MTETNDQSSTDDEKDYLSQGCCLGCVTYFVLALTFGFMFDLNKETRGPYDSFSMICGIAVFIVILARGFFLDRKK